MTRRDLPSVITVTSPLAHADEHLETMQRFRREPYLLNNEVLEIPVYSGNAIRGMLRRAAAHHVCDIIGAGERSLPVESFYLLFSGGYLTGGDHAERVDEHRRTRQLLPHLGLLGYSHGTRIAHGLIDVWRGEPVCVELASTPGHHDHPAYQDTDAPSVFDLLTEVSYTRRDDRADQLAGEKSPVQMRYSHEALIPGTQLIHGATLRTSDELITGALADAVQTCTEWRTLGGRAAIGHGRYTWTWERTIAQEMSELAAAYRDHLAAHRDEIREFLAVTGPVGAEA